MEIIEYFGDLGHLDPFEKSKNNSLNLAIESIRILCRDRLQNKHSVFNNHKLSKDEFVGILHGSLWGNRSDLSLNPQGVAQDLLDVKYNKEFTLIDHSDTLWNDLSHFQGQIVHIVADNAGFELFCDLTLADALVSSGMASSVTFHLKKHPTFVSDALIKDLRQHIDILERDPEEAVRIFATRWRHYVESEKFILLDNYYWNFPSPFWEDMPQELVDHLSTSQLVFIKGDANYRRLHGDLHWPHTTSTKEITGYFPSSFVLLRTLKSEVQTELSVSQLENLKNVKDWLYSGKYGIIQYLKK